MLPPASSASMIKDTLYQQPLDRIADFSFDEKVAAVFPDMIQRSVPGYSTIVAMTGVLAKRYAADNSNIYDLGCSLGASLFSIAQNLDKKLNITLIGVDNSPAMIDRCSVLCNSYQNIQLLCQDIEQTKIEKASVVVMNFSLQFIPLEKRESILSAIANNMLPGGVLVLSEKIRFEDDHLDKLNIELHHAFKKSNGYSDLEISQKRNALEKVLLPETIKTHQDRIKSAGFKRCDAWFQCFNFASLVAIK